MRKYTFSFVLILFLSILMLDMACTPGKFKKDFDSSFLFQDGLETYTGVKFFNLLDGFPVLKTGIASLSPVQFNNQLNASLKEIHPRDVNGSLRAMQRMMLDVRSSVQSSLRTVASILERLRTGDPGSYQTFANYLERLRWYPGAILRGVIPISSQFILDEYNTKGSETLRNQVLEFSAELKSQNSYDLITKIEDMAYKALFLNTTIRAGSEELVNGFVGSSVVGDPVLRTGIVNLAYGLGDMFYERAGLSNNKSSDFVIKELMVNLERYFTVGGAQHSGIYVNSDFPVDLTTISSNLISQVRNLISTDSTITKNSTSPSNPSINMSIANELMVNLSLLDFTSTVSGVEDSLLKLLQLDFRGRSRRSNSALSVSALESLFFTLAIVDSFGFTWSTADNNNITGATGGKMTVGDTLWSLQSILSGGNGINFRKILQDNADSRHVFRNNIELSTNGSSTGDPVFLNTAVLRLLEKESIGATPSIQVKNPTDTIYVNTIPWVMNWIKKVIYQGYGPYYNKNKKDSSGNFLTSDGSVYYVNSSDPNAKYRASWSTADYKMCITSSSATKWVGLGGGEQNASGCATAGTAPTTIPVTNYTYTISEITKSDSERAVDSDEEAFYKNFQWLLYEKRFVVIIPTKANLEGVQEALFIIAIGNGLKGMMGLKPNCGTSNALSDCEIYNGYWNSGTSLRLKNVTSKGQGLQNFSSTPGDSVLMIEGWDYGSTESASTLQPTFIYSILYNLLIPDPSSVKGMIPPVISQNFDVLERLGFLGTTPVNPTSVSTNWGERNKLTPLIVALAKTIDDQVFIDPSNSSNNKNPYSILTNLAKLLARPAIFKETDSGTTFDSVRLLTTVSGSFGLRSPGGSSNDYTPNSTQRSPLSFMIENNRRGQDGVLYLISKTKLVTGLVNLLAELGKSSKSEGRGKIMSGLINIMGQIKMVSTDSLPANGFDFYDYLTNSTDGLLTKLANYPDTRSTNLNSSDWDGVSDSVFFLRDYLSSRSGFSLVRSLEFLLQLLGDVPPTSQEVTAFIELFGQILKNNSGAQAYRIRSILQGDVPVLLESVAPNARNIYAIVGGMGRAGKFFSYVENNMRIYPFRITDLLLDFERFCTSELIQRTDNSEDSLLFSSGILIKAFADIHEFGKKLDPSGFPFADNMNIDENGTEANVWNRINMILSSKK